MRKNMKYLIDVVYVECTKRHSPVDTKEKSLGGSYKRGAPE